MKVITNNQFKSTIFKPNNNIGKTIFIYHGWGGSIDHYFSLAEKLAQEGYTVVIPEIIYHDSRKPLGNPFEAKKKQEFFWKVITNSIDEFDEFVSLLQIDKKNIILFGNSMGGFIVTGIYSRQLTLGGAASINGSGSFLLSETLFRKMDNRDNLSIEEEKWLKKYDPVEQSNCESPLLIMHGDSDSIISIDGQNNYYHYLLTNKKRENVDFKIYKGINHEFNLEMTSDFIDWLNKI